MFQFWKNEKTFERFALELISANSKLKRLKEIGVDLESAIFNDFSNIIPTVNRLVCAWYAIIISRNEMSQNFSIYLGKQEKVPQREITQKEKLWKASMGQEREIIMV